RRAVGADREHRQTRRPQDRRECCSLEHRDAMEPIEVGFQAYVAPMAGRRSAQGDRSATNQWTDATVDSHSLTAIQVPGVEVVGPGATIPLTYDCVRSP